MQAEVEMQEPTWPQFHCPTHGVDLERRGDTMVCPHGEVVPIVNGIPRFAPPSSYADGFGAQWNTYRTTQLDSYTGVPISADRARRCVGEELWNGGLDGAEVLECGCGAGRFTEILLSRGAHLTGLDLSSAIDANQGNFPQDDNHRLTQASILEIPFAPKQYDVVFCLGVVQHTPVPELTIARLYEQVKPGGWLVIDHYTHTVSAYTKLEYFYRAIVKRLPPEQSIAVTQKMVDIFFPLHRVGKYSKWAQRAVSRVSPVRAYYHCYPELNDEQQREWAKLDTHDALGRWYCRFRTKGEIIQILEQLGGVDIEAAYDGNGVEARCRRPV